MFRFTEWFEQGHDFKGWMAHFADRDIATEVRRCSHGMEAIFRAGAESVNPDDDLSPFEVSRRGYEAKYGCECGWRQGWETARGRRPGTTGGSAILA